MRQVLHDFSKFILCSSLIIASTQVHAINAKLGMWEWTLLLQAQDISKNMPVFVYRSCITTDDMTPKAPGADHCSPTQYKIKDNRVDWQSQCTGPSPFIFKTGYLTYTSTSAKGKAVISSNNVSMSGTIKGTYVESCDKN